MRRSLAERKLLELHLLEIDLTNDVTSSCMSLSYSFSSLYEHTSTYLTLYTHSG